MLILSISIGGLILLLYGQLGIEYIFQRTTRLRLQLIRLFTTRYKWFTYIIGGFITLSTKSTITTIRTISSFLETDVIKLKNAIDILIGVNIGTILFMQFLAFDMEHYALLIIILGFLLSKIRPTHGEFLIRLGLIFYGVYITGIGIRMADEVYWGRFLIEKVFTNSIINAISGTLLYLLSNSILVPIGVAIELTQQAGIHTVTTFPILLGGYLGSGISIFIYSLKTEDINLCKIAYGNLLYRFLSWLIGMFLSTPIALLSYKITDAFSDEIVVPVRQLANMYTIFVLGTIILSLPFRGILERFVLWLVQGRAPKEYPIKEMPAEMLKEVKIKVSTLADAVRKIMGDTLNLWENFSYGGIVKLKKEYNSMIQMKDEVVDILNSIPRKGCSEDESLTYITLTGVISNLEKIANITGKEFADFANRINRAKEPLMDTNHVYDIIDLYKSIIEEFNVLTNSLREYKKEDINKILALDYEWNIKIQEKREEYIEIQKNKEIVELVHTGSIYLDALGILERIHRHIQRIANLCSRLGGGII